MQKQLGDHVDGMVGQAAENIAQIGEELHLVKLGSEDDRTPFRTIVGTSDEKTFSFM